MGTIAYTVPQAGTDLNSVADPEIATALTTIKTWANGNVDLTNLSAAALAALQTSYVQVTSNGALTGGQIAFVNGGVTVTLPAPTAGVKCGVIANVSATGASPVTVSGGATQIFGVGMSGPTSFVLGTPLASALLLGNGTQWLMIAGQQDTGWVALTLGTSVGSAGGYTPSARLQGDKVTFKGGVVNNTGSSQAPLYVIATTPVAMRPATTIIGPMIGSVSAGNNCGLQVTSLGQLQNQAVFGTGTWGATMITGLDGLSYTLS